MLNLNTTTLRALVLLPVALFLVAFSGCDNKRHTRTAYEEFYNDVGELDYARREELWKLQQQQKKQLQELQRSTPVKAQSTYRPRYDEVGEMSIEPLPVRKPAPPASAPKKVEVPAAAATPIKVTEGQKAVKDAPAPEAAPEYLVDRRG